MIADIDPIFNIKTEKDFMAFALEIFRYQASNNPVYGQFVQLVNIKAEAIKSIKEIPFMPVSFFKDHDITCADKPPQIIFTSSGTTGSVTSRHLVADVNLYKKSFLKAFADAYGDIKNICILALLPSYAERSGSSLIYMVDELIKQSQNPDSGYYLYNHAELYDKLIYLKNSPKKIILIGVTYALLDFVEQFNIAFPELIVMETGGMKGKRKEIIRQELHHILSEGFGVKKIHSEYGMTELLSQAYSDGDGVFTPPNWMKILIRDINDPFTYLNDGKTGGINIIDLANIHSCSFLATQDLGKMHNNTQFEVLGRFDNSDIRGCNLLVG